MTIRFSNIQLKSFLSGPEWIKYTPEGDQFKLTLKQAVGRQPFVDQSENYLDTATKPGSVQLIQNSLNSTTSSSQKNTNS